MNVAVELTGPLRTAFGQTEMVVMLAEGATIAALADALGAQCDEAARPHLLTTNGDLQPSLLIAINGTAQPSRQAARQVLCDGDRVVLLPPIAGG